MESCLRCDGARETALDFRKGGVLGEDDAFKVVLNPATDPGADKRGLFRSGQVPAFGKDTGGANSWPSSGD
jgi:hypothetical protein